MRGSPLTFRVVIILHNSLTCANEWTVLTGVEDTSVRKDIVCKNIHFLHELSDMQRRHTDPRPSQALSLRSQPRRMGPVVSNLTLVGFAVLYEQARDYFVTLPPIPLDCLYGFEFL